MNRTQIRELLQERGLSPLKKLGQNFLVRDEVIDRIIRLVAPCESDNILEIGPGLGALTEKLVTSAASLTAVELDGGLADYLSEKLGSCSNFRLVRGDFLKVKVEERFNKVVSNLPYYCASEMLFRIAIDYSIPEVYIMLQKEMADRLVAGPGTSEYGALTVSLGLYYTIRHAFSIPRDAFLPSPDVTSSFLKLTRREEPLLTGDHVRIFHLLVKSAFWGRRKTLRRALTDSPHLSLPGEELKKLFAETGINPERRGEQLSLDEFCMLARMLPVELFQEEK